MPGSSEYTPLLSDPSAEQLGESQRTTTTTVLSDQNLQPCTPFLRTTVIMTWISVVSSVLALCLSLTIAFMDWYTSPSSYNGWLLLDCTQQMIMLSALTAIVSTINLVRLYKYRAAMWLLVNLVLDGIITVFLFAITVVGFMQVLSGYHRGCSSYAEPPPEDQKICRAFEIKMEILFRITMCFGIVLLINHLVLFVLRFVIACRWVMRHAANGTFRFPAGQFSVEFTVKLLRQENAAEDRTAVSRATESRHSEGAPLEAPGQP